MSESKANDGALSASIEDYLISLGNSLHTAQRQLAEMSTTVSPGDAPVIYHIPRLDFEFKLSFELSQSSEVGRLAVRPMNGGATSSSNVEAASVIKGSFVAVPLRGGKPPPILTTTLISHPGRALCLRAKLRSVAGEALSGVEVHFNIDRDSSQSLCDSAGVKFELKKKTGFGLGTRRTDAAGEAENYFFVDDDQGGAMPVMLLVEASGVSEKLLYNIPEAPISSTSFSVTGSPK